MRHCLFNASIVWAAWVGFFPTIAFAAETAPEIPSPSRIDIDYARESLSRSSAGRPSISQPAAGNLPPSLVAATDDQPQLDDSETGDGLETRAAVAATWTARQQMKIFGQREIYQAGFYDGLQQAFRDPLIGDWDFGEGHRAGRRDRDAYRIGSEFGVEHARESAAEDAYAEIRAQFHDLNNEPQPRVQPATTRTLDAKAAMPEVREPRLLDVFEDLPLASTLQIDPPGPLPDPFKLYRSDHYDDFYDRDWTESEQAYDYWLDHHRDSAFWRQLSGAEKTRFAKIFRATFSRQLPGVMTGAGESAYARGHGDGWSYGVLAVQDWRYRKGFHEGFTSALRDHARSTFNDRYPSLFDDRYGELFHEWSTTAKPEIRKLVVADDSGDGVFEPGEKVLAHYELVNYGGRGERFEVSLEGDPLNAVVQTDIYLPRRGTWRSARPLAARIDKDVPPRTAAELELTVGGLGRRVAFRVAYPLELDDRVVLGADHTLAGQPQIEVTIANRSRRSAAGTVTMFLVPPSGRTLIDGGSVQAPAERIDRLEAGAIRRLSFPIADLDPLDLLEGEVEVSLIVRGRDAGGRETIFDHLDHRLPELAANPGDRVPRFVRQHIASGRPGADSEEAVDTRASTLTR